MKSLPLLSIALLGMAGCATTASSRQASGEGALGKESVTTRLTQSSEDQEHRISELEARLSLLEQEAHEWRESAASKRTETVRIGAHLRAAAAEAEERHVAVPMVRLHEAEPEPLALPAAPLGVSAKLAVVPLPEERNAKTAAAEDAGVDPGVRDAYRAALRLVRERRWDEAGVALTRFLDQHTDGTLVASATYWRGEVHYAQRKYGDALREFQAVLSRFPTSNKAADSLLKLGMCHLRLGDQAMAQRYFRQVREQYPSSDAARIAQREGSS